MGNTCMPAKYSKGRLPKASHTDDDDSFTRDKPMISTTFSDPAAPNPADATINSFKDYSPSRPLSIRGTTPSATVADAIRSLRDSADLKTLSSLVAVTHQPARSRKYSLLSSDVPVLPHPSSRVSKASPDAAVLSTSQRSLSPVVCVTRTTHATSHANIRDIQASSHDTIRQTKDNLDLLRQIQAMHDEAGRSSHAPSSSSTGSQSRKTSIASDTNAPRDHRLRRISGDSGIPLLSDRGEEATEGHKPSLCYSSPRSSCPVIDMPNDSFALSPAQSARSSQSFSMSPRPHSYNYAVRPTALSLESIRFTRTSGGDMRDTAFSFGGDYRDTRTSMASDSGLRTKGSCGHGVVTKVNQYFTFTVSFEDDTSVLGFTSEGEAHEWNDMMQEIAGNSSLHVPVDVAAE
ncbi:hypothetical protein B5M09_005198 [Aphanomyces astaci]|uniref:PH domain-containing protein n=1 Tax=Aphanomyces astaci TaxID=112090 RepID=A0A425DPN4_APHAT|nr:hypothetical protein B5M09_005198 [Aphanomyces astaci]